MPIAFHGFRQASRTGLYVTRSHSSTATNSDKAYAATLRLPKTSFPLRADPSVREVPFREKTSEGLYRWQWENATGPLFVLHDGPPYANGNLHMGHALNKILKDIINRFHVLIGRRVHYVPGWDCHGLPIENKALKELSANHRSLLADKTREAAMKTAFREISVQKAEFRKLGIMADWTDDKGVYRTMDHDYEIRQLHVFKALVEKGFIHRNYRPVYYSPASRSALAEAELIYVDDHVSRSVYVTYQCTLINVSDGLRETVSRYSPDLKVNLLVWTTTPWTLPTNMAIAVHSDLEYLLVKKKDTEEILILGSERFSSLHHVLGEVILLYKFKGRELTSSIYTNFFQREDSPYKRLPIRHSPHVTPTSGTSLVHCAPAHGIEDYQMFLNEEETSRTFQSLSGPKGRRDLLCLVGLNGTFSEDHLKASSWLVQSIGDRLSGKKVLKEGNAEVIELLKESGTLVMEEKYKHRYPYDWKTNTPVIVTATSQWFADLSHIKSEALDMLKTVRFFPEASRRRLESYIEGRSEWCISRQRPWGVPIPSLHNETTGESVLTTESLEHIIHVMDKKGVKHWWSGPVEDFISPSLKEEHGDILWSKGSDTMDVWFDSGTSWTLLSESLPSQGEEVQSAKRTSLADVCLEGSDQHRGWFQSLVLTAAGMTGNKSGNPKNPIEDTAPTRPYGQVITHGFVLDHQGKKMSKSLGNVISPMSIVDGGKNAKTEPAHGADVLRLWTATVDYERDTAIGTFIIQQTAETLRKIRNSARFILGNLTHYNDRHLGIKLCDMSLTDQYVMHELYKLEKSSKEAYMNYRFPQVVAGLDRFAKVTLSALYLDITKDSLYVDSLQSLPRRSILWVMKEVLDTLKTVMAPILPHLAEEIHEISQETQTKSNLSVFTEGWKSVGEEWYNPQIEQDMKQLLSIRGTVMTLLEQARADKLLRNSLESAIDIIIPGDMSLSNDEPRLLELLRQQESHLKTLFIVSDVSIIDEGSLGVDATEWSRSTIIELEGCDEMINVRVRPSSKHKCPRCWTYTRDMEAALCGRCTEALR